MKKMNEYNYIDEVQLLANEVKWERWRQWQGFYVKAKESEAFFLGLTYNQN